MCLLRHTLCDAKPVAAGAQGWRLLVPLRMPVELKKTTLSASLTLMCRTLDHFLLCPAGTSAVSGKRPTLKRRYISNSWNAGGAPEELDPGPELQALGSDPAQADNSLSCHRLRTLGQGQSATGNEPGPGTVASAWPPGDPKAQPCPGQ